MLKTEFWEKNIRKKFRIRQVFFHVQKKQQYYHKHRNRNKLFKYYFKIVC